MPFLTVLGKGSWRPAPKVVYGPGVHEVDEETAAKARALGRETLVVTKIRPRIAAEHDGPLTLEDIRGGQRGVSLHQEPEAVDDSPQVIEPSELTLDYPCPQCECSFPTAPPLARHVEIHHSVAAVD